jgi:hypothetical protein
MTNLNFDAIFFLIFGLLSLMAGILKKDRIFWMSIQYDGLKELLGEDYKRVINVSFGILSIIIGIFLSRN